MDGGSVVFEKMSSLINFVIPRECYKKFFHEHNFEIECLKIVISKLLGFAVILGSVMVKVPQILKILKASNAEGISLLGVVFELIACTGTLAYGFASGFPFSSYGETIFIAFQQIIIMFLVVSYGFGHSRAVLCTAIYSVIFAFLLSPGAPMTLLVALQASVVLLVVVSKLVQASTNYSNKSTGQLSLITVLLQFAGCAVRILTSLQETGDQMTIFMYAMSTLTNGLLLLQMYLYWGTNPGQAPSPAQEEQLKKWN